MRADAAKWKKKGGDAQHLELRRPPGTHEHGSGLTPPHSGDITAVGARDEGGDFTAARSGSIFASHEYKDPYAEDLGQDSGALSPSARSRGHSFADRLGNVFGASSRTSPADFEPPEVRSPPLSATKQRFSALSPFRGGNRQNSRDRTSAEHEHRVPHPRGPRDRQAREEEEALVMKEDEAGDEKSDDEHVNMGGPLDAYDSRDEL